MSNESDELKATAVSAEEQIDTLKDEEKQKLTAAEEAYAKKQAAGVNGSAPQVGAQGRRAQRRQGHRGEKKMAWVPGVILIGLGVMFLLNNFAGFELHNWWALFIMIPAIGSFSKAVDVMRAEGGMNRQAWSGIAGGLIFTLIASAFLFDLNWGVIWPVFLIIGGLGLFLGAWREW